MAKGDKISMDVNGSSVNKGIDAKGTAMAEAGQVLISAIVGAPAASIVFGANNLIAIYMRKKKAGVGYEYEAVGPLSVDDMKVKGYEVVSGASFPIRTIANTALTGAGGLAGSKVLHVKLTASVTYQWSQQGEVYTKVSADARTALGQIDGASTTKNEVVQRASAFIFKEPYAGYAAGTLIGLKGIKARYRYAAATPGATGSSGVYTSFADGSKV